MSRDLHETIRAIARTEAARAPGAARPGRAADAVDEAVLILSRPTMSPGRSEVLGIRPREGDGPARVATSVSGLAGPCGGLDATRQRTLGVDLDQERNDAADALLDTLQVRMLLLRYAAWAELRPDVAADRSADDGFAARREAATGACDPRIAAILAGPRGGREGLERLLSIEIERPVTIDDFRSRPLAVPDAERWRLASPVDPGCSRLGHDSIIGRRSAGRELDVRVGPVPFADAVELADTTDLAERIDRWISRWCGLPQRWSLTITTSAGAADRGRIGPGFRLARTAILAGHDARSGAGDEGGTRYHRHASGATERRSHRGGRWLEIRPQRRAAAGGDRPQGAQDVPATH